MKFNRIKVAQFQEQDCALTLTEALYEFYEINAHLFSIPEADTQWSEMLVHHDVGHVFFGVNTSILDETAGDYWTLLASDLSFKEYMDYAKSPEAKKLLQQIGFINIIKSLVLGLPLLFRIFIRSRQMKQKWQTSDYEEFLDMPLGEVRAAFNLEILKY